MRLITYEFSEKGPGGNWTVQKFNLNRVNLLAGLSGVGKSRILNTIINLSLSIQKRRNISYGNWNLEFSIGNDTYQYHLNIKNDPGTNKNFVKEERLKKADKLIISRNREKFEFNGERLPKLSMEDIGIYLLREDPIIEPVYKELTKIYIRRNNPSYFQEPEPLLSGIPTRMLTQDKVTFTLEYIHDNFKDFNTQLYLLKNFHEETFREIENYFKEIFPFVENIDVVSLSEVPDISTPILSQDTFIPILIIRENKVSKQIPVFQLSSGMMRAIIQLVDIYTMPKNSIYLIDELENSMGIRSLPTMLDILLNKSLDIQFIFTTHHAYIFNNVDLKYWKILTRKGPNVKIMDGKKFKETFSKSYQDPFIQLINSKLMENGII